MKIIKNILFGMSAGALLNSLILLVMSYKLQLGYYAPCIAGIDEYVGGELNGAAVQLGCVMLAGGCIGAALTLRGRVSLPVRAIIGILGLIPAAILIAKVTIFF